MGKIRILTYQEFVNESYVNTKFTFNVKTPLNDLYTILCEYIFEYFNIKDVKKFKVNFINDKIDAGSIMLDKEKIHYEIKVHKGGLVYTSKMIIHELTHFKQIYFGQLRYEGDSIVYDNGRIQDKITIDEYRKLITEYNTEYTNLAWEKESDEMMKVIWNQFLKSNEFSAFVNKSDTNRLIFGDYIESGK